MTTTAARVTDASSSTDRGYRSFRSRTTAVTGATLLALLTLLVASASALAAETKRFQNDNTRRCLYSTSFGAVFVSTGCSITRTDPVWLIHGWADGTYQLRSWVWGRCLDDSYEYGLRTFQCWPGWSSDSRYQSWYRIRRNYYPYPVTFKNQATGRCLDDSWSYGIRTFPCNGLNYQNWAQLNP